DWRPVFQASNVPVAGERLTAGGLASRTGPSSGYWLRQRQRPLVVARVGQRDDRQIPFEDVVLVLVVGQPAELAGRHRQRRDLAGHRAVDELDVDRGLRLGQGE